MASSDEEGEIVPDFVTNYHFVNSQNALISFSALPLHWNNSTGEDLTVAFLLGSTDEGLQSVYKEVTGWKLELSYGVPEVYVLCKGKKWINLQKPRKSYECVVKSVLIVAHCLHFVKRNVQAGRIEVLSHLVKALSSYDVTESIEKCLEAHLPLIRCAVANDKDLAKSEYLEAFLMEIENPGRKKALHEENQTTNKPKFIVSDDEDENEDDFDDEAEEIFDSVCAFCDNGGEVLPCEGQCMRSFHPTVEAGVDTCCESLGFLNAAQYEAIATFLCDNCKHQKHQCFACGLLGSSDKSSSAEVFPCVSATCRHFYHPKCVAKLLYPSDEALASQLEGQIATGISFTCPIHRCHRCEQGENKDVHELQFAVCRRCPKSYHRKCLPKQIAFKASDDGTIPQRAWDDLLPKRILMYCKKHIIIPNLATPRRDHILFPSVVWKRDQEGRIKEMPERRSNTLGNFKAIETEIMPKVVERQVKTVTRYETTLDKARSSTMHKMTTSFEVNKPVPRNLERPSNILRVKIPKKDVHREPQTTSKPVEKKEVASPPKGDAEMKAKILKLVEDVNSSFDVEEFIKEQKRRCTHEIYAPQHGLEKTITMGKVEGSVKAVKAALRKLEDGGSIDDAKAVCEPDVLHQLVRWKKKLSVYLAPFLIGPRYTSFGRHFTKVDKLKEIVDRLHWYVEDGDTIVDFCCGSNDFSCFMKEKLDSTGKKCNFKNYDLITPKNTFNFEKRDWFSVHKDALSRGSRLVIGLNPPFGVKASLANKFIDKALKFRPKLLILIVPEETKRLDCKRTPYDLIWEEHDMLSGKSFYIPGSGHKSNQPLEDWNVKPPPLSLWSRPDWTAKYKEVAQEHGHIEQRQTTPDQQAEKVLSNDLMEENLDCFNDLSNIMTRYPELLGAAEPNSEHTNLTTHTLHDMADMDLSSPVASSSNSRSEPIRVDPSCIQHEPHPGFGPPLYAYTSDPYGTGVGFGYHQSGHHASYGYPYGQFSHAQPDITSHHGQFSYPGSSSNYGHPDSTSEANIRPPGTTPPDFMFN
ncbi:protein ENHANCED DOWNY MILDEW 2-like [Bidens hawaiensis]|uniref:protein ENHANCED DOWNY MILDEW 2-like n=1 Tax=Bidens hawaiensis TaxID=980011 RepID=UPI004048ED7C